jgi:hypothetical protein
LEVPRLEKKIEVEPIWCRCCEEINLEDHLSRSGTGSHTISKLSFPFHRPVLPGGSMRLGLGQDWGGFEKK